MSDDTENTDTRVLKIKILIIPSAGKYVEQLFTEVEPIYDLWHNINTSTCIVNRNSHTCSLKTCTKIFPLKLLVIPPRIFLKALKQLKCLSRIEKIIKWYFVKHVKLYINRNLSNNVKGNKINEFHKWNFEQDEPEKRGRALWFYSYKVQKQNLGDKSPFVTHNCRTPGEVFLPASGSYEPSQR